MEILSWKSHKRSDCCQEREESETLGMSVYHTGCCSDVIRVDSSVRPRPDVEGSTLTHSAHWPVTPHLCPVPLWWRPPDGNSILILNLPIIQTLLLRTMGPEGNTSYQGRPQIAGCLTWFSHIPSVLKKATQTFEQTFRWLFAPVFPLLRKFSLMKLES